MEQLTPEQLVDYDNAYTLAHVANDAINDLYIAATNLAELEDCVTTLEEVKASRADFIDADNDFAIYFKAASLLMPPRSAFEVDVQNEDIASEAVWNAMSPEQKQKANGLRTAIAERFQGFGITTDSLRVVMTELPYGEKTFTVVHTGIGVEIGDPKKDYDIARSYKAVMSKENDGLFIIDVDGQSYDTRKGMTNAVYRALVSDARERGNTSPPDSIRISEEANDFLTWTMLTGAEVTTMSGDVQIRSVDNGRVIGQVTSPGGDARGIRVRPAVDIS